MGRRLRLAKHSTALLILSYLSTSLAQSTTMTPVKATVEALRLSNTITGGLMPTSDPLFAQMVTQIEAGNLQAAALLAADSNYFARYLARRLALQMQNPALNASVSSDNDATAFLIAHFVGTATTAPSISTIWSDNSTYLLNVPCTSSLHGNSSGNCHAADLTPTQLASLNWNSSLTQVSGQSALLAVQPTGNNQASPSATGVVTIPGQHVGGYLTLSDRPNDNSYAMYGATEGTNLRMIEGLWIIGTGFPLISVESASASPADAPRFIPENNPNFFHGLGQTACMSCHGGGMTSVTHGYATVADVFNFDPAIGLTYNANPTNPALMKSLGSNTSISTRKAVLACKLTTSTPNLVCNPDSSGVDPNQGWDLSLWNSNGILQQMGWTGPVTGQGLNSLGAAVGKSTAVYQNLATRLINEICPLGMFTATQVNTIAAAANPYATPAGTDDVRTMVAMIAADPSCQ